MDEIAKITLDNEMDLILAHRRSMKLAELAGLSLSSQTSFATAVSEVARTAIDSGKKSTLVLCVDDDNRNKYVVASLTSQSEDAQSKAGLEYARRLVNKYAVSKKDKETSIDLYYSIAPSFKADILKLDEWRTIFRNEPAVSPYEEIKKKNEQLQELSEKLQKSEDQYKTLTNSLPLLIFASDVQGQLLYANEWLTNYTGESLKSLNENAWQNVVHAEDYQPFLLLLKNNSAREAMVIKTQARLRNKITGDYFWHQVSVTPFKNEQKEIQYWIGYLADIHAQKIFEETLKDNAELKEAQRQLETNQQVMKQYIAELNRSNQELQQFAFIASHDLQEPVRKVLFYSNYLTSQYANKLDEKGSDFLENIQSAAKRMRNLIQDLLLFSQINRKEIKFSKVDLNEIAKDSVQDLEIMIDERKAQVNIQTLPTIKGDERMMRQLFGNIISNSLKYARKELTPVIDIKCSELNGFYELVFTDNGIGFDEKYLPQMFTLFQRLHSREEYEGTGLGLAICLKIVEMHGGAIRAEAAEGKGASFFVSLPVTFN